MENTQEKLQEESKAVEETSLAQTEAKKKAEEAAAAERRSKMDPVHIAVFDAILQDDFSALKKFIEEDHISPNIRDEHDMSTLLQAAYKGNYEMCEFLLSHGAEVNATSQNNYYTALMMAAVSGRIEIVRLLLEAGANINTVNSIGKTATDLAGFVGQHEIATLIKNYLTMEGLEPYFTPQGNNPARIEKSLARDLKEIVMATNYHPVRIVILIHENPNLCTIENLKKSTAVLNDLCTKCVRARNDFDEVLALKLHYVSSIVISCREHLEKSKNQTLSPFLKTLLKENDRGIKIACEQIIRQSLMKFPYTDLPLLQYLVKTLAPTELGGSPTALHCLQSVFNGIQLMRDPETWCASCGHRNAELRCSACKQIRYCTQRCQKLHWFVHKKKCSQSK